MDGAFTNDTLRQAMARLDALGLRPAPIRIFVSGCALKESDERLFPASKNRSRRIHKKLLKRFGGEFRKVPCIFKTPQGLITHPALHAELKRRIEQQPQ